MRISKHIPTAAMAERNLFSFAFSSLYSISRTCKVKGSEDPETITNNRRSLVQCVLRYTPDCLYKSPSYTPTPSSADQVGATNDDTQT